MSRGILAAVLLLMGLGPASAARAQDWLTPAARAQDNPPANVSGTMFQNVRIFDGRSASPSPPSNVLIKGNIIERISTEPIAPEPGVTVIAGNGRTLMPVGRIQRS